jgi:RimJ/RimL family protein N-acetyltransferase
VVIREIDPSDAEGFLRLTKQVEDTSEFMKWEPGERKTEPEQQRKMIENMRKSGNSVILAAENDSELVGFLIAIGGSASRKRHSVYIVTGMLAKYRGKGTGTKLFEALDKWAAEHQIHRLELTVATPNEAGVTLYKKMGFEVEGIKKHSLFINGKYVDEYYMAKVI